MQQSPPDYDVCLSFASEDRNYIERVASVLRDSDVRVFYDAYEEADLWGKDLYQHLSDVYQSRAAYCVVFISKAYAKKLWPRHELRSAQARAFAENREYLLPARFDDTELPGLPETVAYIDLRGKAPTYVAELISQKLRTASDRALVKGQSKHGATVRTRWWAWNAPLRVVLTLQWLLACYIMAATSDNLGIFALLAPLWILPLSYLVVRFVGLNVVAALSIGGMATAMVGGAIAYQIDDSSSSYGLTLGLVFGALVAAYLVQPARGMNIFVATLVTGLLLLGLGVYEYPSFFLELHGQACVLAAGAGIELLLIAAAVERLPKMAGRDAA